MKAHDIDLALLGSHQHLLPVLAHFRPREVQHVNGAVLQQGSCQDVAGLAGHVAAAEVEHAQRVVEADVLSESGGSGAVDVAGGQAESLQ